MCAWSRRAIAQAHKVFKGTEALGLMQSRAGVTAESLVDLKEALKLVTSENAGGDLYAAEEMEVKFPYRQSFVVGDWWSSCHVQ